MEPSKKHKITDFFDKDPINSSQLYKELDQPALRIVRDLAFLENSAHPVIQKIEELEAKTSIRKKIHKLFMAPVKQPDHRRIQAAKPTISSADRPTPELTPQGSTDLLSPKPRIGLGINSISPKAVTSIGNRHISSDHSFNSCKTCGKAFTHRQSLVHHEKLHQGLPKVQCNMCPKQYKNRKNLSDHIRKFHRPPAQLVKRPTDFEVLPNKMVRSSNPQKSVQQIIDELALNHVFPPKIQDFKKRPKISESTHTSIRTDASIMGETPELKMPSLDPSTTMDHSNTASNITAEDLIILEELITSTSVPETSNNSGISSMAASTIPSTSHVLDQDLNISDTSDSEEDWSDIKPVLARVWPPIPAEL